MGKPAGIFWILFLAFPACFFAQQSDSEANADVWRVKFAAAPPASTIVEEFLEGSDNFPDSLSLVQALRNLIQELHNNAFLEASIDSLVWREGVCLLHFQQGPQYQWARLSPGNVSASLLDRIGYRPRRFEEAPFSYAELIEVQEDILTYLENHGYPFATIGLDSVVLEKGSVSASLALDRQSLVLMDTIQIQGDGRVSQAYLQRYLGMLPGTPYDKERILRSRDRLRELPFLTAAGQPQVKFHDDEAELILPLEKKPASRFDFLIGILPRSPTTGGMLITGSFEGELINAFGGGERLYAQFEQLRPQTQELHLAFDYPYILGLPFGADVAFDLFKNDTTFLNLNLDLGVNYLFSGGNYLKAFWDHYQSTLLTIDADDLVEKPRLPEDLDIRMTTLGLEVFFQKLDYRMNPRMGWLLRFRGGAGSKRILRNAQIEDLELGYLYDSIQLRTTEVRIEPEGAIYLPLFSRSTLKLSARGGFIMSPQAIFRNEQYRLGGNKLLRGFDEESLYASSFVVSTLEYRLLIDQNAYLYTFLDAGWLENKTMDIDESYQPLGFGAGISFETGVGLFGVSLAFGKIGQDPIDFGRPKVHFGYVSLF